MWALVKDFVGKGELSKMVTPVQFLEPLSELQQRCEDLEYSELLDQAWSPYHSNAPLSCWACWASSLGHGDLSRDAQSAHALPCTQETFQSIQSSMHAAT